MVLDEAPLIGASLDVHERWYLQQAAKISTGGAALAVCTGGVGGLVGFGREPAKDKPGHPSKIVLMVTQKKNETELGLASCPGPCVAPVHTTSWPSTQPPSCQS